MQLVEVLLGLAAVNASKVFIATFCPTFFLIILYIYSWTLRLPHRDSELDLNGRESEHGLKSLN